MTIINTALSLSLYSDLSEQIKSVTKESHVRAENTELMLAFQKANISLDQYKVRHLISTLIPITFENRF